MKKAGDLLSFFFDEKTLTAAQGYAKLFNAWGSIVTAQKIPAAAAHSRIVELERHIVLIETDHPGWIQILQTKQQRLLQELQRRFPDFTITGISFRLSRHPFFTGRDVSAETDKQEPEIIPEEPLKLENKGSFYEKIQDNNFKETLRRLEKNIILRNREIKKKNR